MIASAVFITTLLFLAFGVVLMQECHFLIPYRHVIFGKYGLAIAGSAAALFLNLLAAVYVLCRVFFLKDTGRKLAHLEKQLRTGRLADELRQKLDD